MQTQGESLFEQLGGMKGIAKIVNRFYDKVMADERINAFFRDVDMEKQRRHQTAFVAFALGGPQYSGRSMAKAHAGMNLQPHHFDAVMEDLVGALGECGVEQKEVASVIDTLERLRADVLYK